MGRGSLSRRPYCRGRARRGRRVPDGLRRRREEDIEPPEYGVPCLPPSAGSLHVSLALEPGQILMPHPSSSFSATVRVRLGGPPRLVRSSRRRNRGRGRIAGARSTSSVSNREPRSATSSILAADSTHLDEIVARGRAGRGNGSAPPLGPNVSVTRRRQDRGAARRSPVQTRDDSRGLHAGVARVCKAIARRPGRSGR